MEDLIFDVLVNVDFKSSNPSKSVEIHENIEYKIFNFNVVGIFVRRIGNHFLG